MSRLSLTCLLCLLMAGIGLLARDGRENGPSSPRRAVRLQRSSGGPDGSVPHTPVGPPSRSLSPDEIPAGAEAAVVRGSVVQWRRCPAGMIQGVRLADGTEVRFPSYPADPLAELAPPEEPVEVVGWRFPHDPILHARWIRNPRTTDEAEVDLPPL